MDIFPAEPELNWSRCSMLRLSQGYCAYGDGRRGGKLSARGFNLASGLTGVLRVTASPAAGRMPTLHSLQRTCIQRMEVGRPARQGWPKGQQVYGYARTPLRNTVETS